MVWDRRIRHRLGWPAGGTFRISVNKVKIAMLLTRLFFSQRPSFAFHFVFGFGGRGRKCVLEERPAHSSRPLRRFNAIPAYRYRFIKGLVIFAGVAYFAYTSWGL